MSKRTGPVTVNFADFKERKGTEGAIDIEMPDGTKVRIPPPELWPDDFAKRRDELDPETQVRLLLGEQFDAFMAGGGTIMLALSIIKEHHGAQPGE